MGLLLDRIAKTFPALTACGTLARQRPADRAASGNLRVVVDNDQPRGEGLIGLLQDPERPVGLETEWLDDQAGWLKRARQRVKGELRPARRVDQPEADAREWIDEVIGESSPARFEFARTHVLGREAHHIGLVHP